MLCFCAQSFLFLFFSGCVQTAEGAQLSALQQGPGGAVAEERLTARLCDVLRTCISHSTLHFAVWCVSVEALHCRESCWSHFQAFCAVLAGTGDTATAGTGTTKAAPSTPGGGAESARSSTSSASVDTEAAVAASGVET